MQGLKVDTVDDVRRNTTFTVASMMGGTGVLRPELAAIFCDLTAPGATDGAVNKAEIKTAAADGGTFDAEYTEA